MNWPSVGAARRTSILCSVAVRKKRDRGAVKASRGQPKEDSFRISARYIALYRSFHEYRSPSHQSIESCEVALSISSSLSTRTISYLLLNICPGISSLWLCRRAVGNPPQSHLIVILPKALSNSSPSPIGTGCCIVARLLSSAWWSMILADWP